MRIVSAASAFPPNYYPQRVLVESFRKNWGEKLERPGCSVGFMNVKNL
jgi:hypothetical protein